LFATLALTRRPMRILTPVVEIAALAMFDARQNLALGGAVALQFVRDNHPWDILTALEQLAEKLLRCLLVASALHQDVENVVVLIHGAPQVMAFAIDSQKHLIQGPLVPGLRTTAPQPIGVVLSKFLTPLADGFVGHGDAAFEQEFLHVAGAQGEALVEPDSMTDDFTGKAVILVACGVCGWGHAWLPILGVDWLWRGHYQVIMS